MGFKQDAGGGKLWSLAVSTILRLILTNQDAALTDDGSLTYLKPWVLGPHDEFSLPLDIDLSVSRSNLVLFTANSGKVWSSFHRHSTSNNEGRGL